MEAEAILSSPDWINAAGILLLLMGAGLLTLEFFLPTFGLFGFAGVAALLIGTVVLYQTGYIDTLFVDPGWLIGMAVMGLCLSAAGGWYTYKLYRKQLTTGPESLVGETAIIVEWAGKTGLVRVQGEIWQAYSDSALIIRKDDPVLISKTDNLKLKVRLPEKTTGE